MGRRGVEGEQDLRENSLEAAGEGVGTTDSRAE